MSRKMTGLILREPDFALRQIESIGAYIFFRRLNIKFLDVYTKK
jgi:hypothetical protein